MRGIWLTSSSITSRPRVYSVVIFHRNERRRRRRRQRWLEHVVLVIRATYEDAVPECAHPVRRPRITRCTHFKHPTCTSKWFRNVNDGFLQVAYFASRYTKRRTGLTYYNKSIENILNYRPTIPIRKDAMFTLNKQQFGLESWYRSYWIRLWENTCDNIDIRLYVTWDGFVEYVYLFTIHENKHLKKKNLMHL